MTELTANIEEAYSQTYSKHYGTQGQVAFAAEVAQGIENQAENYHVFDGTYPIETRFMIYDRILRQEFPSDAERGDA